ncbi:MAG: poly-gamma-glutamate synthase PgsB [Candidatus Aminicenantes bacterium]|nr:MAG: poly-gamma-glutamate synthase PgsB [Candidatus Aminicenantes bacterium]
MILEWIGRTAIREFLLTGVCVSVFLIYLLVERILLGKRLNQIPLRICVTGTRGKSSVVRLIAACLKDSRMLVFAKTTGSKPCLIFPDGNETEIRRRGHPTILEGKEVLKKASQADVHAVVLEMMSIRPESLHTETIQMIKPHILIITNVREDHVDEIGKTREDIARCFASAIPEKSTVFVPEEEFYPVFQRQAEKVRAKLLLVPPGLSKNIPVCGFEQNFRIALAVVEFLGKDRDKAYHAAVRAAPDFGGLKVWKAKKDSLVTGWYFVSAFAANDPKTTKDVLLRLENRGLLKGRKRIGLLNLRKDRGGRTLQWFDALQEKGSYAFDRLVIVGEHSLALKNKLQRRIEPEITALKGKKPDDLISQIATLEKGEAVVFGMGNMGGIGRSLVDYWEIAGNRYDV